MLITSKEVFTDVSFREAESEGIPRLFLAANSGAGIGLSTSAKEKFRIRWADPHDPSRVSCWKSF